MRTEVLSDAGDKLGYGPLIRMSKRVRKNGSGEHLQILANNAFEAVKWRYLFGARL